MTDQGFRRARKLAGRHSAATWPVLRKHHPLILLLLYCFSTRIGSSLSYIAWDFEAPTIENPETKQSLCPLRWSIEKIPAQEPQPATLTSAQEANSEGKGRGLQRQTKSPSVLTITRVISPRFIRQCMKLHGYPDHLLPLYQKKKGVGGDGLQRSGSQHYFIYTVELGHRHS